MRGTNDTLGSDTIVNLDRNEVNSPGLVRRLPRCAGRPSEVLRLLSGSEVLPDNPLETSEIGAGGRYLACRVGIPWSGDDRSTRK